MSNLSKPVLTSAHPRLHALDALRAAALLLGLVVHAAMAFMTGTQQTWIVHDGAESRLADLAFFVPHMFRMTLFFVVAGLFARIGLQRLGTPGFLRDRFRRIVLVMVGFWPVTLLGIIGAAIVAQALGLTVPPPPEGGGVPLFHLWFLYVLSLFYIVTLALVALRLVRVESRQSNEGLFARVLASPLAPVVLALPLAAALLLDPSWLPWFGIPTPVEVGLPNVAALIAYGSAYALGWWLTARLSLLETWARQRHLLLALAVASTAACLWQLGLVPNFDPISGPWRMAVAGLYALGAIAWTLGLIGLAQAHFSTPSPRIRELADASYWIYLLHLPAVMILQAVTINLPLAPTIKLFVVIVAAFVLLLMSYRLLVRRTWIGAWINGRRKD